jgi:molybdenum cofactor cytidylyltransferase
MLPLKRKTGVIILAAGASSRMTGGVPKQLLVFRGKTLLRRAAETALASNFDPVITVVLGAGAERLKTEIEDLPIRIVVNEEWASGMSSSIRAGLSSFSRENLEAAIVILCDQPLVTTETLNSLYEVFQRTGKPIVACKYKKTIGVPALFTGGFFDRLMNLRGDQGAKKLLAEHRDEAAFVSVPEAAFDVDTFEDYENLKQLPPRRSNGFTEK